jgi:hypothetical protein
MYMYAQYTYSLREGGGGGRVEPERRLEGQQFTKLSRKYQQDMYLQSINSDKHLPKALDKSILSDDDILLWFL